MYNEKLVIVPAPILRAIHNAKESEAILTCPKRMLSILSRRDVIFYYVVNTLLCDYSYKADPANPEPPLVSALRDLLSHTNGVMNAFTSPAWVAFVDENDADIQSERRLKARSIYEYLTGEPYAWNSTEGDDSLSYIYDTQAKVVGGEAVAVLINAVKENDSYNIISHQRLFEQTILAFTTLTADTKSFASLYKGFCELVYQDSLIRRFV
ncbi:hypothetical protein RAY_316 [Erwinia phage vB_EamM_RAY]|jgi:hypothetical protein|uniref:Uncharacterized protein n=8 Tax=Agricanvirus TaxID=1984776 RepID=A0A173GES5_9CAUD|nr:hypothetical protein FDH97_gp322 [Erwinia phage vB_EamM_Deimos-Minion]YP_009605782.1 hypothetical protein FDH98_gp202 [Erwinia phage vB_EamM_RAY]YP_009606104.1 hypothetical protein FDH99_gp205 [Erwinia phage vB_EamM_Simmy50]YP_009622059.1 hypothetical protein FDJ23_gp318 [Erwinia phage vB_EamM_Desertfox]AUG86105.1 hypothetical protein BOSOLAPHORUS_319 [Erwinia phage vB_EamM_Bosolaphorus]AUG86746.1 hypothetical protein MADMEL_319 [Erwinia phage vB_EamM_MadMel]AUG87071.1 hypothetical protein